jgi:endoglucanase
MDRRDFLQSSTTLAAGTFLGLTTGCGREAASPSMPLHAKLPRWRGFNLLEKFIARVENVPFREEDFAIIADWGFDFARLPMSYRCWSTPENWREMDEIVLREIDDAVEYGRQYGVHVSLNFHRAPGYSVDRGQEEPFNLWKDAEALEACAYQWGRFAARYKGIPNARLSFDLVNEPASKDWEKNEVLDDVTYHRVAKVLCEAIRAEDPDRLIIADGLNYGRIPVPMLAELNVAQSCRGYDPFVISHWKAGWVAGSENWPRPTWPLPVPPEDAARARAQFERQRANYPDNVILQRERSIDFGATWDRDRMREQIIGPWKELEAMGVGVHAGECGAYRHTPHDVFLGWFEDKLALWKEADWGWGLWNLRGAFGVLDSGRDDVAYEAYRGHQLDRKLLALLQAY